MLRAICSEYRAMFARFLPAEYQRYCNARQTKEAMAILQPVLTLRERLQLEMAGSPSEWSGAAMLAVLQRATAAERSELAKDEQVLRLLRVVMSRDEFFQVQKLLRPDHLYEAVVERILGSGRVQDKANAILDLEPAERARLWNEHGRVLLVLSEMSGVDMRVLCLGTEADALRERMRFATEGVGTNKAGVEQVTKKTRQAYQKEQRIEHCLKNGTGPDGKELTQEERGRLTEQLQQLGGIKANLLTSQRDSRGELVEGSFLEMLHDDVSSEEYLARLNEMGSDQLSSAKQQILDAAGLFSVDDLRIQRVL
jgi:hypothetical protein